MDHVAKAREIAIGTVTVFLVWSANGTGGGERIIAKLVKINYVILFKTMQNTV